MKKLAIIALALCCAAGITACKKEQIKGGPAGSGSESQQSDLKQFEQEGFVSRDSFRVIIVQPADSTMAIEDINKQLQTKALLSLKRYITSAGKSLSQNTDASLLNLIHDSGKTTPYKDSARTIYVLEISKANCKGYVDTLGK